MNRKTYRLGRTSFTAGLSMSEWITQGSSIQRTDYCSGSDDARYLSDRQVYSHAKLPDTAYDELGVGL